MGREDDPGLTTPALLLLCFFSLALVACSKEPPDEPDRAQTRNAPRGRPAEGAGDPGVSVEAPRKPTIEGARLQIGVEGEEIIVVVGHEGFFPECFLMEDRAVRRAGREGVYGRGAESRWPKEGATETIQTGGSYIVVFHEDPHPDARVADPRKTPYTVLCVEAITMHAVEAHVEGTPKRRLRPGGPPQARTAFRYPPPARRTGATRRPARPRTPERRAEMPALKPCREVATMGAIGLSLHRERRPVFYVDGPQPMGR